MLQITGKVYKVNNITYTPVKFQGALINSTGYINLEDFLKGKQTHILTEEAMQNVLRSNTSVSTKRKHT
jgi:hypothetical protein